MRTFLSRPLTIGGRAIPKRLVLAPLSKLGNPAFRQVVRRFGGFGLLFSEMAGSRSVPHGRGHQSSGFIWRDGELPHLVCQIYGDDPEEMATAARRVADEGFFGVDINFGCAVAAVCKRNCGAALLRDPPLAGRIVAAVRRAVSLPLFVKYRTGWQDDPRGAVDLARRFEAAGADALTFHPRVAPDRRTRPPKWDYIGRVVDGVSIPVFGNGNVFTAADCDRMVRMTGCAGVALGRIAAARPWVFAEWADGFCPDSDTYASCARQLLADLLDQFDPRTALRRYYKFSAYYAANFKFGHTFYANVHKAKSIPELAACIDAFFSVPQEISARPNLNLLR